MKKFVVTGACGGLGFAVAQELLNNGCTVFGLDLSDGKITAENYVHVCCDITDPKSAEQAASTVLSYTDELDGIINVAGIMYMGSLIEQSAEFMQKIMDVNFVGTCRVNNAFFPLIEKGKGRIINFSSEYGKYTTVPFHAFYTASKHAVESYTDGLRRELKYLGLKVIAIRPGAFDTAMTSSTSPYFDRLLKETTHYKREYQKLKPLMDNSTKNAKAPSILAKTVYKAATAKHPKKAYKTNNDLRVKLLSVLPSWLIDRLFYKLFV